MTLELRCSAKELMEVARGQRNTISREVRPTTERKFCIVNDDEEITEVINYDSLRLHCVNLGAFLTVEVKDVKLWEIEDENGELVFYDWKGEQHQRIDIDYTLGAVLDRSNV